MSLIFESMVLYYLSLDWFSSLSILNQIEVECEFSLICVGINGISRNPVIYRARRPIHLFVLNHFQFEFDFDLIFVGRVDKLPGLEARRRRCRR